MMSSALRRHAAISALLFALLASVYLLTYSGYPESGDSLQLYDALTSALTYGDLRLDQSAWQFMPPAHSLDTSDPLPLNRVITEPMQIIASAPLYWTARALPEIGLVHAVWLLNVLVCAANGVVLFWYALALGHSERAGVAAALALGLATALWPYSRSYFREPLLALCLLLAALCLERLRVARFRSVRYAVLAALLLLAALLTKASAALAFPALLLVALPAPRRLNGRTVALAALALLGVGLAFVLLAEAGFGFSLRYDLLARLEGLDTRYTLTALAVWMLSPGGSLWGTSPVVLLAIPGFVLALRAGQRRYPLFVLALVVSFAFGYALLNGGFWFGGLSWPPRFLVPLLPFLLLLTLPVWERLLRRPLSVWWIPVGLLLAYSVFIQLSGATLDWARYGRSLPSEAGGLLDWLPGMFDPAWFRWAILPGMWAQGLFDTAWQLNGLAWMTAGFAVLAAANAAALTLLLRGKPARRAGLMTLALLAALALWTFIGLRTLFHADERFRAYDETLFAMLPMLEGQTSADDLILLDGPDFAPFFMNYDKRNSGGRIVALPFQPGEQPSPEQPPQVESSNPNDLVEFNTRPLLAHLSNVNERLWLLVHGGPDLWYSRRPLERYMSASSYPVQTLATGPITRLVEFATDQAPSPSAFFNADLPTDLVFGGSVAVQGVHLPDGTAVHAGAVLPVSLQWRAEAAVEPNYTAALFLRGADGSPVAQSDAQPGWGFAPTSAWVPGQTVWDHRGLRLPAGTLPGNYQLWVKLYDFGPDGAARDLPVTAGTALDGVIGVLPVTIRVE
ncbi:MAG: hypothetical protein JNL34_14370 [Anaerolineae bacterium]|nr:hypothetical protein [Anaerolineae bacterium]